MLAAIVCFRPKRKQDEPDTLLMGELPAITPSQLLMVLAVAFLFLILSGVGGYGHQDGDWPKHNAILDVLIRQPWPVSYSFSLEQASSSPILTTPLVYYVAYYLPAAFVGKLFGWFWANQALFLWSYIGLCLSLLWFVLLARRSTLLTLLIFVCFSGLDVVGLAIVRKVFLQEPLAFFRWEHIERWSGNWQYPANSTLVFWVPNQALGGWIVCGIIFSALLYGRNKKGLIFYLALTPLWAPFATVGLLPYFIADFFSGEKPFLKKICEYVSFRNVVGVLFLFLLTLFYGAKFYPIPLPLTPVDKGLVFWHPVVPGLSVIESVALLVLFVLFEFLLYGLLVYKSGLPFSAKEKLLFRTTMIFLLILPFYRYGFWNDLVMRASIPALFFLCIFVVRAFYYAASHKRAIAALFILMLSIGALNAAIEFKRHIVETYDRAALYVLPQAKELHRVPAKKLNSSFFFQYIGSAEAPFFRWVTKPLPASSGRIIPVEELVEIYGLPEPTNHRQ
ncbi:MAG: hypothetical protein GY801_44880 [bacterium]|nr:hypothetical protein [bacterium]